MISNRIIFPVREQYPSKTEDRMGIKNGLKRTGDGWQVVARVRVAGKIQTKKRTITGTKEDAKALREAFKQELRTGSVACSLTFEVRIFSDVIKKYREKRGPFSIKHEYNVMRIEKELGIVDVRNFAERFENFISTYRKAGKNYQANRFIEIARSAFQCCVGLDLIKKNPVSPERFPESKEEPRDISLPEEEQQRIIKIAARSKRTVHIARYLQFIFQVPSRKQEIVNIRIIDIDFFNMAIRIHNGTTKNDVGVWKPIPPNMQKWALRRKRMARSLEEPLFARYTKETDMMEPLGDFKNAWNTVRKAAGYPELRIHDTRHISATALVDNNTPEEVVSQVAGWKTNMLKVYYNRNPKRALELVRFSRERKCEPVVNPKQAGAV
jgi:integrase